MQTKRHPFTRNALARPRDVKAICVPGVFKKKSFTMSVGSLQPRFECHLDEEVDWNGVHGWAWQNHGSLSVQTYLSIAASSGPSPERCYSLRFLGSPLSFEHLESSLGMSGPRSCSRHGALLSAVWCRQAAAPGSSSLVQTEPTSYGTLNNSPNLTRALKKSSASTNSHG